MACYVAIGPTLPPALSAIALAAIPLGARVVLGERQTPRSWAGALAVALGVASIGLCGASIAPEKLEWLEPSFLARAAASLGCLALACAAFLGLGLSRKGAPALFLALAAGSAQGIVNALMAPIARQQALLAAGLLLLLAGSFALGGEGPKSRGAGAKGGAALLAVAAALALPHRIQAQENSSAATRAWTSVAIGDPPFQELPRIGGDKLMRGYYEGRWRDYCATALQSELRIPLVWRLGVTLFGASPVSDTTPPSLCPPNRGYRAAVLLHYGRGILMHKRSDLSS